MSAQRNCSRWAPTQLLSQSQADKQSKKSGHAQEGSNHLSCPFPLGKSRIANPILHSDSSYAVGVVVLGLLALGRIISIASTTTVRRKKLRSVPPGGQLSFSSRLAERPTGQTLSSETSSGVPLLLPLAAKDQALLLPPDIQSSESENSAADSLDLNE